MRYNVNTKRLYFSKNPFVHFRGLCCTVVFAWKNAVYAVYPKKESDIL